ncbi:MAG: hypothetical protein J2P15_15090 [Micromonosporaceae bacterium]|nr:hypothetical protein [Micromonosporaceae bacterium]
MTVSTGTDLRAQLVELAAERDALRAQLCGDLPKATRWLQRKVWRQAAALDALHRRVVSQRFVLRTLTDLGRSLTTEEYRSARAAVGNDALRDRIDADPA